MPDNKEKQNFIQKVVNSSNNNDEYAGAYQEFLQWQKRRNFALTWFDKYELARHRAAYLKYKSTDNLDKLLAEFEFHLNDSNVHVCWATDYAQAIKEIAAARKQDNAPVVYEKEPLIHELLQGEMPPDANEDAEFDYVCEAAMIIADTSTIVVEAKSEQKRTRLAKAKNLFLLAGIDTLVQQLNDTELLLSLKTVNESGELLPETTVFLSACRSDNDSFNRKITIVLIDNGRSSCIEHTELRQLSYCLNCKACSYSSSIDRLSPEKKYNHRVNGPRDRLIHHYQYHNNALQHLCFAGPIYDYDLTVCPVMIPLGRMMELSRKQAVENDFVNKRNRFNIYLWRNSVLKRTNMDKGGAKIKAFMFRQMFRKNWGNNREIPNPTPASFNQQWREKRNIK